MKIGVTSQNFRTVTGHAGKTRRFLVYETNSATGKPQECERLDLPKEMSMHAYQGIEPHPIEQFDALITGGCGQGFLNRMAMSGVRVYVTGETDPLKAVQAVIDGLPLPPPEPHSH